MLVLLALPAHAQTVDEYQVKAAFLYNFAKFVEWPPEAFRSPADPITICTLIRNPFGGALEEAVAGKTVAGRGFAIRELSGPSADCTCHMVFVGTSDRRRFQSILEKLKLPGVLTVGDAAGFAESGGVINFRLEDGKIRFEINIDAAAREHLKVSSKLLTLAEIVRSETK